MPFSSTDWRVNLGPWAQAPQVVALQERTWNWYAVPVVPPMASLTVVLVAVSGVRVTGAKAPRVVVLLPVAICSSDRVPVPVHRRSTGSVLLASGDPTVTVLPAARLCTGAVAVGAAATGVLPTRVTVWSVVLAAAAATARFACRAPATVGLNPPVTGRLVPAARVAPPGGAPVRVKSPGFSPAR